MDTRNEIAGEIIDWYQDASEFRVETRNYRDFESGTNYWIQDQFS